MKDTSPPTNRVYMRQVQLLGHLPDQQVYVRDFRAHDAGLALLFAAHPFFAILRAAYLVRPGTVKFSTDVSILFCSPNLKRSEIRRVKLPMTCRLLLVSEYATSAYDD